MADQRQRDNRSRAPSSRGQQRSTMYYAYCITESHSSDSSKSFWNRIGTAWVNQDGSINIKLFAFPLDGKVQLRKPEPREDGGHE